MWFSAIEKNVHNINTKDWHWIGSYYVIGVLAEEQIRRIMMDNKNANIDVIWD